jgi:hypothetical protein
MALLAQLVAGGASTFRPFGLNTGFLAQTRPDPQAWPYCMCGPPTAEVEAYDPMANRWSRVAPLPHGRLGARAVGLPDGRALLAGGVARSHGDPAAGLHQPRLQFLATAELYDPASDRWAATAPMRNRRADFGLLVVPGGPGGKSGACVVTAGGVGFRGGGLSPPPGASESQRAAAGLEQTEAEAVRL